MIDPKAMTTLGLLSRANAARRPDAMCHKFEGRATTFAQFDALADKVANALDAQGAKLVAYLGKNSDAAYELLVGTARAGGIFGPINWRLAPEEVAGVINIFGPDVLCVGPEFHAAVEAIRDQLPADLTLVAMEGGHETWPAYETWRDAHPAGYPDDKAGPDDPCLLLFTSGTTGLPKGVMLSGGNLLRQRAAMAEAAMAYDSWEDDDINLVSMPFAHIGGLGLWVISFANCCGAIITREFDPIEAMDLIHNEGVSRLFAVPAALQFIVRHPKAKETDFSGIRSISYGAAPMPLPLLRECLEVIGGKLTQVYGMTETTGSVCLLPPEDHDPAGSPRMNSAGKAMPGQEIRILDPEGNEVPLGEIGEIASRGSQCMIGYWKNPEATAKTKTADGWVKSGDAGYMDADGYVYIHDRIKDMIISGGENVYPAEVESVLYAHPSVSEAAVIGVPDEKWGEAVKAVVTLKEGASLDEAAVIGHCRQHLAAFKCPKTVDVIPAMPRNASGKLLKRDLRAPYWAGRARQVN
ncbi:MAG: acyl-CoA synthetase [Rhodobacteraceae bacterium]|nr:acyl-CoA synthetase [Paracoccaceae bacterium]